MESLSSKEGDLQNIFKMFDRDGDGKISPAEFK